jgi:parvulin-like peptidyl-prolyl isomerase
MRLSIRSGLFLVGVVAGMVAIPGLVSAQAPATKGAAAAAPKAAAAEPAPPARPANFDEVLATVNGDKITRGDLVKFLSRYPVPPVDHQMIYRDAIDTLINTRLIGQFLARQQIAVTPEKLNEALAQFERGIKASGRDLNTALREENQTIEEVRRELTDRLRWIEFVTIKATDAELKRWAASHKDLLTGTQVKASHIYLEVPDNATPAEKEKIREKLVALKKDIDDKKISFAEAANKNSQDPANAEGAGGDIGYFDLSSGIVEEFATAAMAMKPGEISGPVETSHGFHLILVTERSEGKPVDFEQQRTAILQFYAAELQKQILTAERKRAEDSHAIDIKPMPADLFPPETAPATSTPDAAKGAAPK